jgi:hypothetical protein
MLRPPPDAVSGAVQRDANIHPSIDSTSPTPCCVVSGGPLKVAWITRNQCESNASFSTVASLTPAW